MRIIRCIRKGMMHAVHYSITVRTQVIAALKYPGKDIKYLLGKFIHGECLVSGIPVQKKGLKE